MAFDLSTVVVQTDIDTAVAAINCPPEHKAVLEFQAKNLLTEINKITVADLFLTDVDPGA